MTDPATLDEFNERVRANTRYSGSGPFGVVVHLPCPFCAAPNFLAFNLLRTMEALRVDNKCAACERTLRCMPTADEFGGITMTCLQTGGADPPSYLPKMPRFHVVQP